MGGHGRFYKACPFLERVTFSNPVKGIFNHYWNKCLVDGEHCDIHGCMIKIQRTLRSPYGNRVSWVCPRYASKIAEFAMIDADGTKADCLLNTVRSIVSNE